jgi:methyl-accepting chemotaxis protein
MKSNIDATLSIRKRIFLGFTLITLITIVSIGIILEKVIYVKDFSQKIASQDLPIFDSYIDLNGSIYNSQAMLYSWLMTHDEKNKKEREHIWKDINEKADNITQYSKMIDNPDYIMHWNKVQTSLSKLKLIQDKLISMPSSQNLADSLILIHSELLPELNETLNYLDGFIDSKNERGGGLYDIHFVNIEENSQKVITDMKTVEITLFSLLGIVIVSSFLIAIYTSRGINNYINIFRQHSNKIASGDLTQRLALTSNDDMAKLGNDLNLMTESLSKVTTQINNACHDMISTLEEVRQASNVQSSGATEQASSINEITSSLEEIEKSSTQTIEKAKALGEIAERTRSKGQLGLEAVEQSTLGMKTVREKVQTIAKTILELSHQTQQVGEITAVVNTLAQQSKMLALNASIEAAKAGDAGKGFAVVASEVKNLAEQSEHSTAQVQKILEDIRHATEKAVMATEEGIKGVDHGAALVEETGEVVRNLSDVIHEATIASQQIEAAIRQEGIGIEQITAGMNEINQVTYSYVESVKQTTEALNHLTTNVKNLKEYIDIYKV